MKRIESPLIFLSACVRRCWYVAVGGSMGILICHSALAQEAEVPQKPMSTGNMETRSWVDENPKAEWGMGNPLQVKGGEPLTRTRFVIFLNDLRVDFRRLLFRWRMGKGVGDEAGGSVPIEVTLWGSLRDVFVGESVRQAVTQRPDGSFVIEVAVKLHDRFDEKDFRQEMVRAFLLEQIMLPYSSHPDSFVLADGQILKVPEWLIQGFDQLIEHRRAGSPSAFYRGVLASGQLWKPADLFAVEDTKDFDSVRKAVFRASASAMVEALLNQADGDLSLRSLMIELGRPNPQGMEVLLRQFFPAFRETDQGLEKWWALEVAALGQRQSFEFLDRAETERLLAEAITVHLEAPSKGASKAPSQKKGGLRKLFKGSASEEAGESPSQEGAYTGSLDQFDRYRHHPDVMKQLTVISDRIQVLKRVGFPLYRPVFFAYEEAIQKIAKGNVKNLAEEFASIEEMRKRIGDTLIQVEDALNYYEATRTPLRSDAFDGYLKMRRELSDRPASRRNDTISQYMDALEWEFR